MLRHLVELELAYRSAKARAPSNAYTKPPTTDQIATFLGCRQSQALSILNDLEILGLITKNRRRSAGLSGYGYDGSLYSEVHPTEKTVERYRTLKDDA